ncbi:hypothetical protein TrLO_g6846 [Triparma laevis f. longispina]|uniref:Myb-like domain-containing protein n=1 Tax=Triparma laevis f. longispina TaxID=1714387 RepID=A0A9W7FC45_9STRA|nr:hypothetical protein TrLO_g6846 [Triparma laevis f. longispina]
MATVKREKMYDKDNMNYVDEIEIKIEIKRQEGESLAHPDKFRELREANPSKVIRWTEEEDGALKRGIRKHGTDWEKIHETENEVFGRRTAGAIKGRYYDYLRE